LLEKIVHEQELIQDWYFIRLFYSHNNHLTMASEFMINNNNIEYAQEQIAKLDWMSAKDFYSLRAFFVLKRV